MCSKKVNDKTVVVTGASTGIGFSIAKSLADKGFNVIAGVRKQSDINKLRTCSANIDPVYLDVTRQFDIDNLAYHINTEYDGELHALVNNAGVMLPGPIELNSMDQIRHEMEVNYFGTVALTKKLLFNIKRSEGRIINISSMNGKLSMPACGGYSASKFALEAFTDALRIELFNAGVKVSLIEPGQVKTALFDKALEGCKRVTLHASDSEKEYYASLLAALEGAMNAGLNSNTSADMVADAVYNSLISDESETRYIVGDDANQFLSLKANMSDRDMDMQIMTAFGLISADEKVEITQ